MDIYKVTYPDGNEEFWTSVEEEEIKRLENLYGSKLVIEKVKVKGKRNEKSY